MFKRDSQRNCECQSRIGVLLVLAIIAPSNSPCASDVIVAARLRSLRTDDPLNKGHPRSIEKEVEL